MNKRTIGTALLIGLVSALGWPSTALADDAAPPEKQGAVAIIHQAGNHDGKITGTVSFTPVGDGVKIVADINGLSPGKHGIHIHQKSDLSSPDLKSAGPHFNPGGASHHHGGPEDPEHHAGDLGNIEADSNGHGHLELTSHDLTIEDPKTGVIGHSVIIHANEDDYKSQPAGNAGDRIAGGAINKANAAGRQPDRGKD